MVILDLEDAVAPAAKGPARAALDLFARAHSYLQLVVDFSVKVRVRSDNAGADIANVKMYRNPFDEIVIEEAVVT